MKGFIPLLNSFISNLQFLRLKRSGGCFYRYESCEMKSVSPLQNSYISNLQFLRSERSGECFYSEIMVRMKRKSPRNMRFVANERYYSPPELLYLKFAIFTIGAERGVFLLLQITWSEK